MQDVDTTQVHRRSDWQDFWNLARTVYAGDTVHVHEPFIVQRAELDPARNPIAATCEAQAFITRRGDAAVARAVAIRNPSLDTHQGKPVGLIGYFECSDDMDAAKSLTDACATWCAERGAYELFANINFSMNYRVGILTSGFDQPHTFMMPHHPSYYGRLFSASGFDVAKKLHAYRIDFPAGVDDHVGSAPSQIIPPKIAERAEALRAEGFRARPMKRSDLRRCFRDYNQTWGQNYLHTPFSDAELEHVLKGLRIFADRRFCIVAEYRGELAGYLFAFPDYYRTMRGWNGRVGVGAVLEFVWKHRVRRRVDALKTAIVGVPVAFRGHRLTALLNDTLLRAVIRCGVRTMERSWILEDNTASIRQAQAVGGKLNKEYTIFTRAIGSEQLADQHRAVAADNDTRPGVDTHTDAPAGV